MKIKKIIGTITSSVITVALIGGGVAEINPVVSRVMNASAEGADNSKIIADLLFVDQTEMDSNGRYCQWYRTENPLFIRNGINVKYNGKDVTYQSMISFPDDLTPGNVYDGKNFDYEIPIDIHYGLAEVPSTVYAKIGLKNDANLDHKVDISDAAFMARNVKLQESSSKQIMNDFAKYLTTGTKTKNQNLNMSFPKALADQIAAEGLNKPKGDKVENKGDGKYSLALSQANGMPGETVNIQVVIDANDSFESLDAVIEWNDETLESAAAVAVNGSLASSYTGKGMVSLADYGTGKIKDGAIASINFKIPEDAAPGSQYDIYFSNVGTMSVISGNGSENVVDQASISGAKISVNKPKTTTTTGSDISTSTTTTTVSETTTQSTTSSEAVTTTQVTDITTNREYPLGDADHNYKVNIADAAFIAKSVAKRQPIDIEINPVADFNKDNVVDIRDAAAIAKAIAKRIL